MRKNDLSLYSFPSNRIDGLAMLFLENQDLRDLTPAELTDKYIEVCEAINERFIEIRNSK